MCVCVLLFELNTDTVTKFMISLIALKRQIGKLKFDVSFFVDLDGSSDKTNEREDKGGGWGEYNTTNEGDYWGGYNTTCSPPKVNMLQWLCEKFYLLIFFCSNLSIKNLISVF